MEQLLFLLAFLVWDTTVKPTERLQHSVPHSVRTVRQRIFRVCMMQQLLSMFSVPIPFLQH